MTVCWHFGEKREKEGIFCFIKEETSMHLPTVSYLLHYVCMFLSLSQPEYGSVCFTDEKIEWQLSLMIA